MSSAIDNLCHGHGHGLAKKKIIFKFCKLGKENFCLSEPWFLQL